MFVFENTDGLMYATLQSAGFDIRSTVDVYIPPGGFVSIKTGLKIIGVNLSNGIPELQIRSRSSLITKHQVSVLGGVGTVDADYRGEISIPLMNFGSEEFFIAKGDRVAQGVCSIIHQIMGIPVKGVIRGLGGHGSTGVK